MIRLATPGDAQSLADLAATTPGAPHWTVAQYQGMLTTASGTHVDWVTELGERIIGFRRTLRCILPDAELESIAVHPPPTRATATARPCSPPPLSTPPATLSPMSTLRSAPPAARRRSTAGLASPSLAAARATTATPFRTPYSCSGLQPEHHPDRPSTFRYHQD